MVVSIGINASGCMPVTRNRSRPDAVVKVAGTSSVGSPSSLSTGFAHAGSVAVSEEPPISRQPHSATAEQASATTARAALRSRHRVCGR